MAETCAWFKGKKRHVLYKVSREKKLSIGESLWENNLEWVYLHVYVCSGSW
jgi:hypothetical protein